MSNDMNAIREDLYRQLKIIKDERVGYVLQWRAAQEAYNTCRIPSERDRLENQINQLNAIIQEKDRQISRMLDTIDQAEGR